MTFGFGQQNVRGICNEEDIRLCLVGYLVGFRLSWMKIMDTRVVGEAGLYKNLHEWLVSNCTFSDPNRRPNAIVGTLCFSLWKA